MKAMMKVYVVLVQPEIGDCTVLPYVRAVFHDEEHAKENANRYLREYLEGWAEVQSFIVV